MNKFLSTLVIFSAFIITLSAATKSYQINFSDEFPVIDGNIEQDSAWQNVAWQGGFIVHRQPGKAAGNATRFKMFYTADSLYIAVECFEAKMNALKKIYNFNEFWSYDTIEFFCVPKKEEIIHLVSNYEGMQFDAIAGVVAKRTNYQTGWKAAGRKFQDRWSVEFCVPLYLIGKVPAERALKMPFNICRNSTTINERSTWNFQSKSFNNVADFGELIFNPAPVKKRALLQASLRKPHWISLIARWQTIRNDPAWQTTIEKFSKERIILDKLLADKQNYAKNANQFYKELSKIEAGAKLRETQEQKRIWKRLFEEEF